ncbi:MAG: undecaprenyl diphosphate synthase family protein, partial [Oscillospiraceae bacterium]|nr:undecaprenyl diphosphate synthase family protein [Oscillospiraceae bacterium]
ICLNYGGRDEILRAARRWAEIVRSGGENAPDEERFSSLLWSAGLPDPELLIRPGGEQRLSNFLLWQCAYSEFYFTDTLWPDFGPEELDRAISAYRRRERRFGGI